MLLITPPKCEDADALLRLWCHETQRVFCDRLVSTTDRGMANAALRKWDGLGVHLLP